MGSYMGACRFLGVYGYLWVSIGTYRCLWVSGWLWVLMGFWVYLDIKNIAYFLIQEPQKMLEITHMV